MEQDNLVISPKTKVLALIEAYPHLEEVLIAYVPTFEKLKNPVLRKTVAKIATLQQAAAIGNVKVEDLINVLRKGAGQDEVSVAAGTGYNTDKPAWFDDTRIWKEIDIRPLLDAGEQPVNQVMADLNGLEPDHIYKVVAPFIPAPLIDKAMSLGIDHWLRQDENELYHLFFIKTK